MAVGRTNAKGASGGGANTILLTGPIENVSFDGGVDQGVCKLVWTSGTDVDVSFVTTDPIDLTPYSKLWISWEGKDYEPNYNEEHAIVVSTIKTATRATYDARILRVGGFYDNQGKIESLDISALNGSYYIRAHVWNDSPPATAYTKVYSLWLEV